MSGWVNFQSTTFGFVAESRRRASTLHFGIVPHDR
jgi:hypothetical protein